MRSREGSCGRKVLLVDDDLQALSVYGMMAEEEGYAVVKASSAADALRIAGSGVRLGLAVLDLRLPDGDGLDLFRALRRRDRDLPVIILTGHGSIESAVRAVKEGAYHYLEKPPGNEQLMSLVRSAMRGRDLEEENARLRKCLRSVDGDGELIGRSRALQEVYGLMRQVAPSQASVLIAGESGTGKELAARALHRLSARSGGPFVSVNCGALPPHLLESELFGHEKGAFTGAASTKPGMFELADGGTVFLDEVGECSPDLQVRLLRVLQEKEFRRVGGTRTMGSDFRLVAATNRPLEKDVEAGSFRGDLFYRIHVVSFTMPPLRDRREDIPLLAAFFADKYSLREGKAVRAVSEAALSLLGGYHWPGNVRELENVMERGVVVCRTDRIEEGDLPDVLAVPGPPAGESNLLDGERRLDEVERLVMAATLRRHNGNKSQAARVLGISRKLLYSKIRDRAT